MLQLRQDGSKEIFYATKYSAGFDLYSNKQLSIKPGEWALIPTGLRIVESIGAQTLDIGGNKFTWVPEIQIRPRSGLAAKHGITVLNSPSTIDCDYRGEILVTLINHGKEQFLIEVGDRIAQGVVAMAFHLGGVKVADVERGTGGFGSTGT